MKNYESNLMCNVALQIILSNNATLHIELNFCLSLYMRNACIRHSKLCCMLHYSYLSKYRCKYRNHNDCIPLQH